MADFDDLYREHYAAIERYVRRRVEEATASDVVADVFTVAWRRLDDVLASDARLWLFGVARHVVANHLRGAGCGYRLIEKIAAATRRRTARPRPWWRSPTSSASRSSTPAQRAAVLRVLASVPGLQYAGETVDRAGRRAEAFTLRSSHGGLRNDLTLVVDPATGRILDEVELLREAGKLTIKVPAVIGYTSYD